MSAGPGDGLRVIAVDWSGARVNAARKIWLAEAGPDGLVRLESGREREAVADHLEAVRAEGRPVVAGLDFAFSVPAWFLGSRGLVDAPSLWRAMADGEAERILESCEAPFWGRPGKRRVAAGDPLRRTDRACRGGGRSPKSVFQVAGAGSVGAGSLRGMGVLWRLSRAGWAVWPFTPAGRATLVEIYPRALTGAVVKSDAAARREALRAWADRLTPAMARLAASSEDAFDAAVSALAMWEGRAELAALPSVADGAARREGWIWTPSLPGLG